MLKRAGVRPRQDLRRSVVEIAPHKNSRLESFGNLNLNPLANLNVLKIIQIGHANPNPLYLKGIMNE